MASAGDDYVARTMSRRPPNYGFMPKPANLELRFDDWIQRLRLKTRGEVYGMSRFYAASGTTVKTVHDDPENEGGGVIFEVEWPSSRPGERGSMVSFFFPPGSSGPAFVDFAALAPELHDLNVYPLSVKFFSSPVQPFIAEVYFSPFDPAYDGLFVTRTQYAKSGRKLLFNAAGELVGEADHYLWW